MAHQARLRLRRKTNGRVIHFFDVLGQQPLGQRQDVGRPLAQRLPGQREDRQAIVEVFTKAPRRHLAGQVAVAGGQHANIQADRLAPTDPLHFTLLQHAQQLGLQALRHFGNFIEQNGAALGQLELARRAGDGAGEGTLLMAEQRGLEHVVGNRRAVDGNEGFRRPWRLLVNESCQHLLAGAGLAGDQHRRIALRHPRGQLEQLHAGRFQGHRAVLLGRRHTPEGVAIDQRQQGFRLERLDQIIRRALAYRIHRTLDRGEGGHQQHRQLRLALADQGQ
ncbi:hypothetical protein D3C84_453540 [compost metagenome]